MDIVAFEPGLAESLARCYNALVEPVPECSPVPAERFASPDALRHKRLRDEEIAVAREGGEAIGFVHVGIARPAKDHDEPQGEPGVIRFLSYPVGRRPVGQALLEWAEDWMRERGRDTMVSWEAQLRYRFYHFAHAHLSERIGHVCALMGMNGYLEFNGELYLTWRNFAPPQLERPPLDFDLKAEWEEGRSDKRLAVRAMQGQQEVGFCHMKLLGHSPSPDGSRWCHCGELSVSERLQGNRLGLFLLSSALHEMRKAGCEHAAITTGGKNYRAQLMYTNMGFQVSDYTVVFRKELEAKRAQG